MGHYTALCHNASAQTWHLFDDSLVREVQDTLVQSPNAYMLLYSRKPFPKPKIQGLWALQIEDQNQFPSWKCFLSSAFGSTSLLLFVLLASP